MQGLSSVPSGLQTWLQAANLADEQDLHEIQSVKETKFTCEFFRHCLLKFSEPIVIK